MKKLVAILLMAIIAVSAFAEVKSVYVNPLQNKANLDQTVAKRFFKKGLLGLTKAKTISVASGQYAVTPGTEGSISYDYIMTITVTKVTIEEAGTVGNLFGILGSSSNSEKTWSGKIHTEVRIVNAATGEQFFKTELTPYGTNKDKSLAVFKATDNFDYDMTDMTDDAFRVGGEIVEATEVDKKNIVKKVRLQVGSKDGVRKDQCYELYKVVGENYDLIGAAKCEEVLNANECVLSISGKKGGDKVLSELIQNQDGSYSVQAWSRSKTGFLYNNMQGIDKLFSNNAKRLHYLDPFGRKAKPKVGFLALDINDYSFSSQKQLFQHKVLEGMRDVTTIEFVPMIYQSVEQARENNIDGLLEITVDKVFTTSQRDKQGKVNYETEMYFTIAGVDVLNNVWIDMKSYKEIGSSSEGTNAANAKTLTLLDDRVKQFAEDVFPVAVSIVNIEEAKKNSVKKVRINAGTDMGVRKGMQFDIYEQRKEGGEYFRFLLGEGKVEKDQLSATEAIVKVKGKDNGDEKLFELQQNLDENTEIVLVSKTFYNVFDKLGF